MFCDRIWLLLRLGYFPYKKECWTDFLKNIEIKFQKLYSRKAVFIPKRFRPHCIILFSRYLLSLLSYIIIFEYYHPKLLLFNYHIKLLLFYYQERRVHYIYLKASFVVRALDVVMHSVLCTSYSVEHIFLAGLIKVST